MSREDFININQYDYAHSDPPPKSTPSHWTKKFLDTIIRGTDCGKYDDPMAYLMAHDSGCFGSFDAFLSYLDDYHVVTVNGSEISCTCRIFLTDNVCKHTVCVEERFLGFEFPIQAVTDALVPLGGSQKKVGRPPLAPCQPSRRKRPKL